MICNSLGGNICGDYGLSVSQDKKICHGHELYQLPLVQGRVIDLNVWWTNVTSEEASICCFLWATTSGNLPDRVGPQGTPINIIDELLTVQNRTILNNVKEVRMEEQNQKHYIDTSALYNIQPNKTSNLSMTLVTQQFVLNEEDAPNCNLSFYCPRLEGHPCGNYIVALKKDSEKIDFCSVSQALHNAHIEANQPIDISLWTAMETSPDFTCHMWCSYQEPKPNKPDCGQDTDLKSRTD